ncbi:dTDP-4-dehydrorhamnose 3,5-epimerase [Sphingomonas crocodyli]|uniref:dTDP-4-dehydrorhamnose 3,5-epimerase n=1 Tax=Sphingomonas crocodyli TaxID=1979270 RepID=A0A437MBC8_9SPHN|nr:dTDP-4-dehydrorhamnose 3,5-epimerase [Sphingomonas crocodyli]RVT94959.1 dTDP-4-dehydrorhamnose 3,5-epimerase [Sphingomonas crocodyli]
MNPDNPSSPIRIITPARHGDARGWFMESWREDRLAAAGVDCRFVQDNHSFSATVGTLRGVHFQTPPHAQAKLIRCTRGAVIDVAVDLRRGSPTYGRHVAIELSAENGRQMFIPVGFGHGFVTITPDCELLYKCSAYYAPEADAGLRWDCPDLAIDWGLNGREPTLSDRDRRLPCLAEFDSPFAYDGSPLLPL